MQVTNFINFHKHNGFSELLDIVQQITLGTHKEQVDAIRYAVQSGHQQKADEIKRALPAFTPSGKFNTVRKAEALEEYSQVIHLDFDKLEYTDLEPCFKRITECPYTLAAFLSPSGNGFKVFVKVGSNAQQHTKAYLDVQAYYENLLDIPADAHCKDITRLCFVSHDENAYTNLNAIVFELAGEPSHAERSVEQAVNFTNNKYSYNNGSRNAYIFQLACNCNRYGIQEDKVQEYVEANFQHETPQELSKTIASAYKNNVADFARFANNAKRKVAKEVLKEEDNIDYLKTTPTIPEETIQLLPNILKEGANAFATNARKRDVFLTSAFCIISGCLPNVNGVYDQERVFPHLFSFVIAPAASGKGVLKNAKTLGDEIHKKLKEQTDEATKKYEADLEEYKSALQKRKKDDPMPEKPEKPEYKILFIPANTSQAKILELLVATEGQAVICETEADSMSGTKKQDWGDYSAILRSAFHHEKVSVARKTDNLLIEIPRPKLAVSLSGTPAQVPKLIESAEDGLFSRFLFYAFKNDIVWRDPSPQPNGIVYTDLFERLSIEFQQAAEFLQQSNTIVELTSAQWQKLNKAFEGKLNDVALFTGEDAACIVYRLGLILFRFCMIFTALRKYENGEMTEIMICTNDDFKAALSLSDVYLEHSLLMFNNLIEQKESPTYKMPNHKRRLFSELPETFKRQEAIEIGKSLGMQDRSVDSFLRDGLGVRLEKIKSGLYKKVR